MRRICLALTLLAACTPPVEDFSDVLPDERLLVDLPAQTHARSAVGDSSEFYTLTAEVTADVNGLIESVLLGIEEITTFDPTWMDDGESTALWGPWSDNGLEGRLWVQLHEDDAYTWALEGRPAGAGDWLALVAGEVDPGATDTTASGRFALDLDVIATLDPSQVVTGVFATEYAVDGDYVEATAGLQGFSEVGGALADAGYRYEQTLGVEGLMDLVVLTDATGNATPELHIVRSRWDASGAGRADAYLTEGDFGELVYTATECWDVAQQVVFYEDNATLTRNGDEADCIYAEPSFNES